MVLAAMSAWQFRPFVLAQPEVAWTLLQRLARRLREAQTPPGRAPGARVDPFAAIMLGGVALLLVALLLLGRFYPGSGAQQLDWRPTRSPELEVQNEIDDIDQMREAVNRRRRARGEAELTEDGPARAGGGGPGRDAAPAPARAPTP